MKKRYSWADQDRPLNPVEVDMNPKYYHMEKRQRISLATAKVLDNGWQQAQAAREFGVSRQSVASKLKTVKANRHYPDTKPAVEALTNESSPQSEDFRPDLSFEDFNEIYFAGWQCPDCEIAHPTPDFHKEIMSVVSDLENHRILVNLPPFHAKSTLITVKYSIYRICMDPNVRIVLLSASNTFADSFIRQIQLLLTDHQLYTEAKRDLITDFGPFKPDAGGWSATTIYVEGRRSREKDPTLQSLGWGSQIYGRRSDLIIIDDLATLKNQQNPDIVAAMIQKLDNEVSNRVGAKKGQVIYVGTRVNHGDIYSYLNKRDSCTVMTYPAITDVVEETVLWPEHEPYAQLMIHKDEMTPSDFQLVYQQVETQGEDSRFDPESIEACKDMARVLGDFETGWRLVMGIDFAGGTKDSGYTAFTVWGVDLRSGKRYLVDLFAQKGMRAPQLKQKIFELTNKYPLAEIRPESNGIQSQLVQYNDEIIRPLALAGVKVVPHHTGSNKWDPNFGVESMSPLYDNELISLPWGDEKTRRQVKVLIDQLLLFGNTTVFDLVMSTWFADLGLRDMLRRAHLPLYDAKLTKKWPAYVRNRRRLLNPSTGEVTPVRNMGGAYMADAGANAYKRIISGAPTRQDLVVDRAPAEKTAFINKDGFVEDDR